MIDDQPEPNGEGNPVIDKVLSDLENRAEFGREKYGTLLRTNDGRDSLKDAYMESLDLTMYLAKLIMEDENE